MNEKIARVDLDKAAFIMAEAMYLTPQPQFKSAKEALDAMPDDVGDAHRRGAKAVIDYVMSELGSKGFHVTANNNKTIGEK